MRFISIAVLFFALCGCDGPLMKDLDNFCEVEYTDGSKETIVCSRAEEDRPAFHGTKSGQILVRFHNGSYRMIPMESVKSWSFLYGDKDHYRRYEELPSGKWVKKNRERESK